MVTLILAFMMQFTVSTRAGFVNYVQGSANVSVTQTVGDRSPIRTGDGAFLEVLLKPGSYLRLAGNTEVELDGVELPDMGVRVISGTVLIEAAGYDKRTPLTIGVGNLKGQIVADGIYLVSDGNVLVLDGKMLTSGSTTTYGKGWQLSQVDAFQAAKVGKRQPLPLELWSKRRSDEAARANFEVGSSLREEPNVKISSLFDVWLWSPGFGGFTYMPGYGFRSPYGRQYLAVRDIFVVGGLVLGRDHRPGSDTGPTDTTATATNPSPTPAPPAPRPAPPAPK